jgi:hypothetical protein
MKKKVRTSIIAAGLILVAMSVRAQDNTFMYVNYNPSFSTGDSKDWANEFSWRGVSVDLRIPINGGLTAGLYSGWTVFREASDGPQTETIPVSAEDGDYEITLTANQYYFINQLPLLATMHYHFGEFGEVRPYVGLGAGVYFTTHALEMGLYRVQEKNTQIGIAPMAGVAIPLNRDTNFNLGAIYNWAFENSNQQAVTSVGFNLGIGWRFY